jgi:hypothetical protein
MRDELQSISRDRKTRRSNRQCGYEPLENRIVLSATALAGAPTPLGPLLPDAQVAGIPGGAVGVPSHSVVTVTSSQIITESETIPRFVANPTITNIRSGNWTDPSIWSLARVPTDGDRVMVAANSTILYFTVSNAHLNGLEIDGSLIFSISNNTRLIVGNLTVMPSGLLQIGTAAHPVLPQAKAELVIADQPLNLAQDPQQFGTGLIGLGTVSIHGSPMSATWLRLATEPRAGDNRLQLSGNVSGWQPGDTLVLPDTRQVPISQQGLFVAGTLAPEWEEVTIDHIQGNTVFLTGRLQFDHLGAHNTSGGLELVPHVALLDRNVVIRSENPNGTRGYTLFTARAAVDIAYTRFEDLGRTTAVQNLDDTTFGPAGNVTHIGTNQEGRYAVFFDNLLGPVNPYNTGYQFQFSGNTVDDSLRWAVALDNSSYGLLQNNVIYGAQGAGFVTEEGTEVNNVFNDNITIRIQGTQKDGKNGTAADDYARGGDGFWFRRDGNTITGNVAADSTYSGFVFDGYFEWDAVTLPAFRGADNQLPSQSQFQQVNSPATISNNEAYGMSTYGLWAAYVAGDDLVANPNVTIADLRLWNIESASVLAYHTSNLIFDGLLILGNRAADDRNDTGTFGMALEGYENRYLIVRNSRIEGVRLGIVAPANDASLPGIEHPTIIENSVLKNYINIVVTPSQVDGTSEGNSLVVRNVRFTLVSGLPAGPAPALATRASANIQMQLAISNPDLTQPSVVRVYSYNGVAGDDFQVYYREQAASYIVPQTSSAVLTSSNLGPIGSPVAGLTNAQSWSLYRIAIAGGVAPAGASASRPEIGGLVGPIQDFSNLVPQVVLITPWNGAQFVGNTQARIRYNVIGLMPTGGQVYFTIDNGPPTTNPNLNLAPGQHKLRAFIGDATGKRISGMSITSSTFTILAP